ncbi:MAG: serine hydrolase domain-containing protein [Pseudomonadota bacterium]
MAKQVVFGAANIALACSFLVLPALPAKATDCANGQILLGEICVETEEAASTIGRMVEDSKDRFDLTAAIVSVEVGGTPVLTEAFGTSMAGIPARPEMHFRNGAVAIAYLASVLLRLQEDGVLSLDDHLSQWFPDYPRADDVTLAMLINSTSGYADYVNLDLLPLYEDPFRQFQPEELIEIGLSQPMACDPGTCFNYAHTNIVILGEVLSAASGRSVEDLIDDYVLAPLALENTRSESTPVIQQPVLHAFTAERGVLEDSTYWNPSWTLAEGSIMTTDIGDLLTSAIAIGSGSLLAPDSYSEMVAPTTAGLAPFSNQTYYALGVLVTNDWVVQTPSFAGYAAVMAYLPSEQIGIAVAVTSGAETPDSPRPANTIFSEIGAYLAPETAPGIGR